MVSIFKAVRDNNVETVENLISLASKSDRQTGRSPRQAKPVKTFNLNKRSLHGRTALHLAATWNRVEIAKLLIDCPLVNINLQDLENGWTALHKALYSGNIEIAIMLLQREDIDLNIKDWEGLRPFELYSLTVRDVFPRYPDAPRKNGKKVDHAAVSDNAKMEGTELYSWGSNTNYVLGHRDPDNRVNPDRVPLDLECHRTEFIMQRPNVAIKSIQMSKYHTAVVTDEPSHNLLICGFGRGGRLGTGNAETQLALTPVPWSERILSVALGKNHTIAVTESRNAISFGDNTYGQLGYEMEYAEQFTPRRIQAACLKKQPVIGVAASAVHSVIYTSTDLFTFGLNQGQLGYHASGDDNRQIIPRKVGFSVPIMQVVANDFATAVLSENNEITLLTNYTQTKLFLPISRFPSNIQVHSSSPKYPVRLLGSGSEHLGAITSSGDVYLWQCKGSSAAQRSKSKQITTTTLPKRVWTCRKWHMAAMDACIGLHGGLIVCTRSGQVLVGNSTKDSNEGSYKFTIIPYLQRCVQVCASPSGAFAAVRSELTTTQIAEKSSTLLYDLASSLPHVRASEQLDTDIAALTRRRSDKVEKMEAQIKTLEEKKEKRAKELMQGINDWFQEQLGKVITSAWEHIEAIAARDETLDVTIKLADNKRLYCHQYMLAIRSPVFREIFQKRQADPGFDTIDIEWCQQSKMVTIILKKAYDLVAILLLMDYLYMDTYSHPMNAFYQVPNLCRNMDASSSFGTPNSVQKDLVELASLFGLEELKASASSSFSHRPKPTLEKCLSKLLTEQIACDVDVELQRNEHLLCHEMVLRQRCPFFAALFEPGSIWVEKRRGQGLLPVDVTDLRKPVFSLILKYLYEDCTEDELFREIADDSVEGMMNFVLEVLAAANELLLDRLKRICERALLPFLKLRSATTLLEKSKLYLANALKERCLYFVASNLDYLLINGALDSVDTDIIRDLEKYIREDQASESRIGRLFKPDISILDEEFSESLYAQSREDISPIGNFAEILITVYPQQEAKKASAPPLSAPVKSHVVEDTTVFHMDEDTVEDPKTYKEKKASERKADHTIAAHTRPPTTSGASNGVPWTAQGLSVGSAEQKVSLREYLEQQQQQQQSYAKLSSTPPTAFPKHSPPYTSKKLSQKERRKLQQQQELAAVAAAATPKPVWGKVAQVAKTPPSEQQSWPSIRNNSFSETKQEPNQTRRLSNANDEDELQAEARSSLKGRKIYVSSKEELLKEMESRPGDASSNEKKHDNEFDFDPIRSLGPTFEFTPIRKNKKTSANRPTTAAGAAIRSFHEIQKQQELEDMWIKGKKAKKSLLQIQIEEQAIENLTEYYVQIMDAISGEWFEIHRIGS